MQIVKTLTRLLRPPVPPDGEWHWCETMSGPVMRRNIGGRIEDRPMTTEEKQEYLATRAGW